MERAERFFVISPCWYNGRGRGIYLRSNCIDQCSRPKSGVRWSRCNEDADVHASNTCSRIISLITVLKICGNQARTCNVAVRSQYFS